MEWGNCYGSLFVFFLYRSLENILYWIYKHFMFVIVEHHGFSSVYRIEINVLKFSRILGKKLLFK